MSAPAMSTFQMVKIDGQWKSFPMDSPRPIAKLETPTPKAKRQRTSLVEKYRPETLAGFVGMKRERAILGNLAATPYSSAWLLLGPSGLGKTTMALAICKAIDGQLHHVPSRQCNLETVNALIYDCHMTPMFGRYHVVLIDEADQMTSAAQLAFLSALDSTGFPPDTVFLFTANSSAKLEDRFLSRVRTVEFSTPQMAVTAALLETIWTAEDGGNKPDFAVIAESAKGNIRSAIMALEMELLIADEVAA